MKTTVELPLTNKAGKRARLELDHDTGEVRFIYTSLGDPRFRLEDLQRITEDLAAAVRQDASLAQ